MGSVRWTLRVDEAIRYFRLEGIGGLRGVCHAFSTRCGPTPDGGTRAFTLSSPPGSPLGHVAHNRSLFLTCLRFSPLSLRTVRQNHSDRVVFFDETKSHTGQRPPGDALVTNTPGLLLGVSTADCYPILVVDPRLRVVGAVHAGWRGTAAGIVMKTVSAICSRWESRAEDLIALIGPGIASCCYIVGPDVYQSFQKRGHSDRMTCFQSVHRAPREVGERWRLDLAGANHQQLASCGLRPENIFVLGHCTSCEPDWFFSYRRDGSGTGRMLSVIGLTVPDGE